MTSPGSADVDKRGKPRLPRLLVSCLALLAAAPAAAQAPTDVPAGHWARQAVLSVCSRGVMTAPGGRFNGSATVSRREMAITMAKLGQSLEAGRWPVGEGVRPLRPYSKRTPVQSTDRAITRYELAAAIDRVARFAARGLPARPAKPLGQSEALPPRPSLKNVPRTDPAYPALVYLAHNRMLWDKSPLMKPGPKPVTATEASDALSMVVIGLTDMRTDEPQNRPDVGEPPARPGGPKPQLRRSTPG